MLQWFSHSLSQKKIPVTLDAPVKLPACNFWHMDGRTTVLPHMVKSKEYMKKREQHKAASKVLHRAPASTQGTLTTRHEVLPIVPQDRQSKLTYTSHKHSVQSPAGYSSTLVLLKHPMLLPVPRKHLASNANVPKNRLAQDIDVFMRLLKCPENAKMSCLKKFCLPPSPSKGMLKQQILALEENGQWTQWTMERQRKASSHYTELM